MAINLSREAHNNIVKLKEVLESCIESAYVEMSGPDTSSSQIQTQR